MGLPIQDEFYQEQISIKNDHQNENLVTVEFVSTILSAVKRNSIVMS